MAQVEQQTQARRRVRVRRIAKETISSGSVKSRLDELTVKMRDAQARINAAAREIALHEKEAFDAMQAAKLTQHSCPAGDLTVKVPSGRSSTYIDPEKYHDAVGDEEAFFSSVGVKMTEARKNLSGKEFDAIAVVTPGKPGKPTLKTEFYYPEGMDNDG
jgi:hypothetical protein